MYFGRVYQLDVLAGTVTRTFGGMPEDDKPYEPLQITFMIDQTANALRARAEITVYGLNRASRQAIYEEGAQATLTAGWRDNSAIIFTGSIENIEIGRSGPDQFLKLFCSSITEAWREARVSQTFAAGSAQVDIIRTVAEAFGFPVKFVGDFSQFVPAILGRTIDRNAVSALNSLANSFDFSWLINNGRTYIVRNNAQNEVEPIVYRPTNGIIGTPEITEQGVDIDVLLNPLIRPWDTYTVESETGALSVNGVYYQEREFPKTNGESTNKVIRLVHEGDFYGDVWQTRLEGQRS